MKPIYQFTPNSRQFIDRISGNVPANTSVVFRRLEKGYSAYFNNTADLDSFGVVTGVKTIVMVIKPTANTKLLQDDGTDRIEINGGNISGTGLTECTVNTVNTDAVSNNVWSLVIAEFSGGIDFSTDLEIDVTADIDVVSVVCYNTILSNLEKGDLWYDFNHLYTTSTPAVIHHKIAVESLGSVLTHDYQNWRGGIVPDLSGSGNDGTPNGFVDCGRDCARFDGSTSKVLSSISVGTSLAAEFLGIPGDLTGEKALFGLGVDYYKNLIIDMSGGDLRTTLNQNWGARYTAGTVVQKELQYVVITISYIDATHSQVTHCINGVQQGTNTFPEILNSDGDFSVGFRGLTIWYNGSIKFVRILPYALTEAKIQANWNSIANQAIFNEPMFNQLPDNRSYTAGMYLEDWYVFSGTFTVEEDSTGTYIECTGNGVIQYKGIDFSMYKENGFVKKIVGDISSDQGVTVDNAVNVAWASNVLSVTLTTGQKLYELVITKGEEV